MFIQITIQKKQVMQLLKKFNFSFNISSLDLKSLYNFRILDTLPF